MNFFKNLFWWFWADEEDIQRLSVQQIARQQHVQPAKEPDNDLKLDEVEYEEFFD